MTKYPTQHHINDNATAACSSDDKEQYGIQQKVTKEHTLSNPLTVSIPIAVLTPTVLNHLTLKILYNKKIRAHSM